MDASFSSAASSTIATSTPPSSANASNGNAGGGSAASAGLDSSASMTAAAVNLLLSLAMNNSNAVGCSSTGAVAGIMGLTPRGGSNGHHEGRVDEGPTIATSTSTAAAMGKFDLGGTGNSSANSNTHSTAAAQAAAALISQLLLANNSPSGTGAAAGTVMMRGGGGSAISAGPTSNGKSSGAGSGGHVHAATETTGVVASTTTHRGHDVLGQPTPPPVVRRQSTTTATNHHDPTSPVIKDEPARDEEEAEDGGDEAHSPNLPFIAHPTNSVVISPSQQQSQSQYAANSFGLQSGMSLGAALAGSRQHSQQSNQRLLGSLASGSTNLSDLHALLQLHQHMQFQQQQQGRLNSFLAAGGQQQQTPRTTSPRKKSSMASISSPSLLNASFTAANNNNNGHSEISQFTPANHNASSVSINNTILDVINSVNANSQFAHSASSTPIKGSSSTASSPSKRLSSLNGSKFSMDSLKASSFSMNSLNDSTFSMDSLISAQSAATAAVMTPSHPPPGHQFVPIAPTYAASGQGRRILIFDSKSHPGHRREFAYKTRFTNRSGQTTVYYRCMACRSLKHRLQRLAWGADGSPSRVAGSKGSATSEGGVMINGEKIPGVPCIAVKNDLLINDPDYPDANHHFCKPLSVEESKRRLQATIERGVKRSRTKTHPLDEMMDQIPLPKKFKKSPSHTATSSSTDGDTAALVGAAGINEEAHEETGTEEAGSDGSEAAAAAVDVKMEIGGDAGENGPAEAMELLGRRMCLWTDMSESGGCLLLGGDEDATGENGEEEERQEREKNG